MQLKSHRFDHNSEIPRRYSQEGENLSPALEWTGVPAGTQELALIVDDPDAPGAEPWVHWVLYSLSPSNHSLPEGVPHRDHLADPKGARQGINSGNQIGYAGPMPPVGHGSHRYFFKLYALDTKLNLKPGMSKTALLKAMKGHVLADAELMGRYRRG
ncbi:MAG: hypothetical protein A2428_07095 [Bdellovibrionales bacterium RIFOXYC1_FULL_54_43]|nr:MAG: hypothetical protein A2428_07095 [Bdellovibrionales bacterium RIFOXYC1_FULL_54_43]OFZ82314.1 MAG: hypothetical protein A2603_07625 [Bdellovibrionales bacterium RIFOXYD1_FULL_55_31]